MKKKPFSWLGASMVFAIGAVIVLVLAMFLGRGLSMNTKTGEIKVDSKQAAEGQPVAETFGKASPIAGEKGASVEASMTSESAAPSRAPAASSSAKFVTHGDASPIAVGPESHASATLKTK
ncbi:hypothetical protein SAMN05428960_0519 [Mitsuaria sp. PDC51]|uniref:hypothetical protein n=1 Tax=Mitsuaria sp. PDC51 TaxID=1881035 RepID=UPI0008EE6BF9|nr:hypothetical protein [Mitsuaria sp. PDC51]SFR72124.1 hypothetical protein SAMN05428960_0519 [Mitsuaria sp. PDC51]